MGQPQKVSNTLVWTTPTSGRGGVGRPPTLGVGATKSGAPPQKNTFLNDPPPGGRGDKIHSPPPKYIFWTAITPAGTGHSAPRCCSPRGWGFVQKVYSEGGGRFCRPLPQGWGGGVRPKSVWGGRRIFPLYPQGWGGVQISVLGGVAPDFVAPYSPGVGGGVVHGKVFWGWRRIFSTLPPRRWGWGVGQTSVFGGGGRRIPSPPTPQGWGWGRP